MCWVYYKISHLRFLVLQSAKDCLTNDRSRQIYNATGSDPASSNLRQRPSSFQRGPVHIFTQRGSPFAGMPPGVEEELLRTMFGGK